MSTDAYEQLMLQAWAASQADDATTAIRLWSEACRCEPSVAVPHLLIGAELAQCGRVDEAEAAFAHAALLSPDLLIARFQLGLLQFTSGRIGMAMLSWQPLLATDGDGPFGLFVQGFAALARDDFTAALTAFEAGIERNVDNAPLNADIRQVIDRIRGRVEPATPAGDEHVLLANYQQHGLPH